MKKVYYEKIGRKYVPVAEYDSDLVHSLPKGNHLIMCYPGGSSTRYDIDPNYAAMIAAGRIAEDEMLNALIKVGELRMQRSDRNRKLTESQKAAWENLVKEFGETARQLEWASAQEIARASIRVMMEEAQKLLTNPAVKKAFDHFLLVCELTKDEKN